MTHKYRDHEYMRNGESKLRFDSHSNTTKPCDDKNTNSLGKESNTIEATTNILRATVTNNFCFFQYGLDATSTNGSTIYSTRRRAHILFTGIFDKHVGILAKYGMKEKEIEDFRRITYFEGSFIFTARPIPSIDTFPFLITANDANNDIKLSPCDEGDTITITSMKKYSVPNALKTNRLKSSENGIVVDLRCSECTSIFASKEGMISHCKQTGHKPYMDLDEDVHEASTELFLSFCNVALHHALRERMAKWGKEYIDPKHWTEPKDKHGRSLGVRVFRAFSCDFGIHKLDGECNALTLTVDLRAKVIRTKSLLSSLCHGMDPNDVTFDRRSIEQYRKEYLGEVVICTYDRKCYPVVDLDFENSPDSLLVQGCDMSHTEYFKKRKGIDLIYPNVAPMVVVLGRNNKIMHLPAEVVCANDFDRSIKQQLPIIASFQPKERNEAIEEMRKYLIPGGQKTKGFGGGLLPSLGIILEDSRVKVQAEVLPLPLLSAAGITIPKEKSQMWAPMISRANWSVDHKNAVEMKVVVIHHQSIKNQVMPIYEKIRDFVNKHNSHYRFSFKPFSLISTCGDADHCKSVEDYFYQRLPHNIFVLDLVRPPRKQALDTAYCVVKYLLTKNGYLSQFVNFNTHDHSRVDDQKSVRRSNAILQGVARQILAKCGARVWWVNM
jgi:PAZ domain.